MNTANPRDFPATPDARALEATSPSSDFLDVPETRPLQPRQRQAARALSHRVQDLWRAQCRQVECHSDRARADDGPIRREPSPGHRQARLVGGHGGARQADRHRALLRHLSQRARRLHGIHRPCQHQYEDRQALGSRLSRHHHRRHGGRAGAADRPPRHRPAVLRDRRLHGRHAGAAMGGAPQGARLLGGAGRHRGLAFLAEHRLPRGGPPGGDGRPQLVRGPLPGARQGAAQRPGRGAHGRAHHLPVGGGAAAQVRSLPAGRRGQDLQLQCRLPGGELPAPPGLDLRRPLRRQQLSLHHPRHRLFRPRRRIRRRAGQRLQGHQDALLRGVVHQRLALSDAREPRDRARAERRRRQRQLRGDRVRQGPRRLPARGARAVRHHPRLPQCGARPSAA